MLTTHLARRFLGWVLTAIVVWFVRGYYDYNKYEIKQVFLDRPWQTIGLLVIVVIAIACFVWAVVDDSKYSTVVGLVLAFAAGAWGIYVFRNINGWFILLAIVTILVLAVLGVMTLMVRDRQTVTNQVAAIRLPQRTRRTTDNSATTVTETTTA